MFADFQFHGAKKSDQEEKKPRSCMWNVETNKRDISNNVDKSKRFILHHKIPDTQYLPCIQSHRSAVQLALKQRIGYWPDGQRFESGKDRRSPFFSKMFRPVLGPTQGTAAPSLGVVRLGPDVHR